tara:strand:+ start:1359 stop:2408 length:1050 start_codon:yes stop_codon:yes gene_type:complete
MDKKKKQRLEQLVRQGIVPSSKLPILMQAMSNLHMGKQLMPKERDVLAKYMFNMTDIMLKDTTVFNRAKLHTQKTRYQTEETEVDSIDEKMIGGVDVVDGPEDEERMRHAAQTKAKKLSIKKRDKFRLLSPEVKKEKMKAGVEEQVLKMNEDYKAKFEAALKKFGVSNIRDLPADKKKEFFNHVDASHVAQNEEVEIEEDMQVKQAIGIASDKRYKGGDMTGAVSAIEKMRKGLSDHPQVKAVLKRQNEETEQLDEYGNPAATPDRLSMIRKAADRVQSGQSGKDAQKRAKADMKQKGAQRGMAPTKKEVEEQINIMRKTIKEGTVREKVEAYTELNRLIEQFKITGEL